MFAVELKYNEGQLRADGTAKRSRPLQKAAEHFSGAAAGKAFEKREMEIRYRALRSESLGEYGVAFFHDEPPLLLKEILISAANVKQCRTEFQKNFAGML